MNIICRLFGHRPDMYGSQGVIANPYHDGVGRSHRDVKARCVSCRELFPVGSVIDPKTSIDTKAVRHDR